MLFQATEDHGGVPAAQHPLQRRNKLISDAGLVRRRVRVTVIVKDLACHVGKEGAQFLRHSLRGNGGHLSTRLFTSHFALMLLFERGRGSNTITSFIVLLNIARPNNYMRVIYFVRLEFQSNNHLGP